jgi:hypothetical protein
MELSRARAGFVSRPRIYTSQRPVWIALSVWAALIAGTFVWGSELNRTTAQDLGAPPLFGHFDFRISLTVILMGAFGALLVGWGVRIATSISWRGLLGLSWAGALVWTLALNMVTGLHQLMAPLTDRFEYRAAVSSVGSPARFLETFVARLHTYPIHVQGHPPGMVLLLWTMKQLGLGAVGWEAGLVIAAGTSSVLAALIVCRAVAGEDRARRCVPFLILAPMALWVATSADALFLGVSAWSLAAIALGMARPGLAGRVLLLAGGSLFALALMLSYGTLALTIIPAAIGWRNKTLLRLVPALIALVVVLGLFWAGGFSWAGGFAATRQLYETGIARHRSYVFFCVADLAAFAIVIGPAGAAGLATLRDRSLWLIVGATVVVLLASDISGYSKGEVERIWLPFAPWILLATSEIPAPVTTALLSLQALIGVAVALGVRTAW